MKGTQWTNQNNPLLSVNWQHLAYSPKENVETLLEFLGLVIGKAIFEGIVPWQKREAIGKVPIETFHCYMLYTFSSLDSSI